MFVAFTGEQTFAKDDSCALQARPFDEIRLLFDQHFFDEFRVVEQVEIAVKYAGYIDRQRNEITRAAHYENMNLPPDMDYNEVDALSFEVRQCLSAQRPATLGQASRISGVTPAAISLLLVYLKKRGFKKQ